MRKGMVRALVSWSAYQGECSILDGLRLLPLGPPGQRLQIVSGQVGDCGCPLAAQTDAPAAKPLARLFRWELPKLR